VRYKKEIGRFIMKLLVSIASPEWSFAFLFIKKRRSNSSTICKLVGVWPKNAFNV
jgi:hypothetical protein